MHQWKHTYINGKAILQTESDTTQTHIDGSVNFSAQQLYVGVFAA